MKISIASYKKAQIFKKDYVRKNGQFIRFEKSSANHSYAILDLEDGEEFDARGSVYREGVTKWTATSCQSWAKFRNDGGQLVCLNFNNIVTACPNWLRVVSADSNIIESEVCFEA